MEARGSIPAASTRAEARVVHQEIMEARGFSPWQHLRPMLVADQVSFAYGSTHVVDAVSVTVAQGAIVGVLGPNGAGKTTLLTLLSGTRAPTSGTITIGGQPLGTLSRRAIARRLAIVPQDTHPTFAYTALEIVLMGRYPWLGAFEVEGPADLAAARDALDATGTTHLASRPFSTLSGGEKQRVVIASALAQLDQRGSGNADPAVLLLDEPTTALDLRYQLEVIALVRQLHAARGVTIVLSTHDLRLAAAVCTDVVLLSRGAVQAHGAPADVLTPECLQTVYDVDRELVTAFLR